MEIELAWLFAMAIGYLAVLFLIAYATDAGWLPEKLVSHPAIYALSLGVYATSWTYYGSVGLANNSGYAFLTIYLGVTAAFILGPYLLKPLLRLCREYQLTSIADLLAFRYGGRGTGLIVTLFMLIGILPYISLQIRAVTESIQILSKQVPPDILALVFCLLITVFAVLFGARHLSPREKHRGLVVAIAFESAVKLIALLVAGVFVVTQVFESPVAMNEWANTQQEALQQLYQPSSSGLWSTLLLLAFCAAFLLPRQYHMTFVENERPEHLNTAYWLFPLYLLLLNLPIIPILFAGRYLELDISPDFFVLGMSIEMNNVWLASLIFLGGLSAASAMMIVTTLALSYMCLNYLLLPASLSGRHSSDFYQRLLWSKRLIIAMIIAAGYGFYIVIESNAGLASLGLISFVAAAQLLPGVIGLLYWARATQVGFLAGLSGGAIVWFLLLIWPLLNPDTQLINRIPVDTDIWTLSTFCTLATNGFLFAIGSLLSKPTPDEQAATQAAMEQSSFALSEPYTARSVNHYLYAMQEALGNKVAKKEIESALTETGIDVGETRQTELRLFHERLERNLTGLLGPTTARNILRPGHITFKNDGSDAPDARLLEMRLEASREQMRGMTKQLDDLRRYLRDVLLEMPLGVCSIAANGNVFLWNSTMETYTGISESAARNRSPAQLPEPWNALLKDFADSDETHRFRCHIIHNGRNVTFNLHKADVGGTGDSNDHLAGQVILMEDRTDLDTLETELAHSERLASVGRLAAGVAHEIGNPLTGIASIAQNLQHDSVDATPDDTNEQAGDILNQVDRINNIVRSLLTFSHAEEFTAPSFQAVDLTSSVNDSLRLVRLSPDIRNIKFDVDLPKKLMVQGDSNQLAQVFVNLINNACDATGAKGTISIKGSSNQHSAQITVCDNGSGIDPAIREQVFEPFFTTKEVGRGTGLGLSLVYSIVTNHGGKVRILDNPNTQGICIQVTIPTE